MLKADFLPVCGPAFIQPCLDISQAKPIEAALDRITDTKDNTHAAHCHMTQMGSAR